MWNWPNHPKLVTVQQNHVVNINGAMFKILSVFVIEMMGE